MKWPHLGCDGSEYKLAGTIWLLAQEEVEEGEFVDVNVELHVAVGGHGAEGLLGDGRDLLLAQGAHVQEGSVEQSATFIMCDIVNNECVG